MAPFTVSSSVSLSSCESFSCDTPTTGAASTCCGSLTTRRNDFGSTTGEASSSGCSSTCTITALSKSRAWRSLSSLDELRTRPALTIATASVAAFSTAHTASLVLSSSCLMISATAPAPTGSGVCPETVGSGAEGGASWIVGSATGASLVSTVAAGSGSATAGAGTLTTGASLFAARYISSSDSREQ